MHMPPIGAGTFRLQGRTVIDSVTNPLALGYRHIDTAQVYGNEARSARTSHRAGTDQASSSG